MCLRLGALRKPPLVLPSWSVCRAVVWNCHGLSAEPLQIRESLVEATEVHQSGWPELVLMSLGRYTSTWAEYRGRPMIKAKTTRLGECINH
jgi:hypothetical protein